MKAQQEYESLTKLIEAQKEKKLNRFIAALAAVIQETDEKSDQDTSSEEDDEDIALISLFSLRIKAECKLIREGSRDLVEQVKEDIEELVSHVQSFEYESTISETVRSDTYDLLKSICLENDWCIIEQNYSWNLAETAAVGIPMEMFFLFMGTATYMQNIGKNGTAVKVLEALCTYSRKRANINHKEVIVRAISQIGGDSPEAAELAMQNSRFLRMTLLYMRVIFTGFMETACRIWDVQKRPCMRLNSVCRFEKTVWEKKTITQSWQSGDGLSVNFLVQEDAKEEKSYCISSIG